MEKMNEEDERSKNSNKSSSPSLDSALEIKGKNRTIFSLSLIIINVICFIISIYILNNKDYYLNPDFNFSNRISLYIFIILYGLGMLSALILAILFSLIMKIVYYYKNNKNNSQIDSKINEQEHTQISFILLNDKQNELAFIPFTLSYFIVFTIGLYFCDLPYSIILLIKLFQNDYLCKVFSFKLLYLFMTINFFAGLMMVLVLFYMIFIKKRGNVRKLEFNIDNNNVENIRNEIRNAMK